MVAHSDTETDISVSDLRSEFQDSKNYMVRSRIKNKGGGFFTHLHPPTNPSLSQPSRKVFFTSHHASRVPLLPEVPTYSKSPFPPQPPPPPWESSGQREQVWGWQGVVECRKPSPGGSLTTLALCEPWAGLLTHTQLLGQGRQTSVSSQLHLSHSMPGTCSVLSALIVITHSIRTYFSLLYSLEN